MFASWFRIHDEVVQCRQAMVSSCWQDARSPTAVRVVVSVGHNRVDAVLATDGYASPTTPGWSTISTAVVDSGVNVSFVGACVGQLNPRRVPSHSRGRKYRAACVSAQLTQADVWRGRAHDPETRMEVPSGVANSSLATLRSLADRRPACCCHLARSARNRSTPRAEDLHVAQPIAVHAEMVASDVGTFSFTIAALTRLSPDWETSWSTRPAVVRRRSTRTVCTDALCATRR